MFHNQDMSHPNRRDAFCIVGAGTDWILAVQMLTSSLLERGKSGGFQDGLLVQQGTRRGSQNLGYLSPGLEAFQYFKNLWSYVSVCQAHVLVGLNQDIFSSCHYR